MMIRHPIIWTWSSLPARWCHCDTDADDQLVSTTVVMHPMHAFLLLLIFALWSPGVDAFCVVTREPAFIWLRAMATKRTLRFVVCMMVERPLNACAFVWVFDFHFCISDDDVCCIGYWVTSLSADTRFFSYFFSIENGLLLQLWYLAFCLAEIILPQ